MHRQRSLLLFFSLLFQFCCLTKCVKRVDDTSCFHDGSCLGFTVCRKTQAHSCAVNPISHFTQPDISWKRCSYSLLSCFWKTAIWSLPFPCSHHSEASLQFLHSSLNAKQCNSIQSCFSRSPLMPDDVNQSYSFESYLYTKKSRDHGSSQIILSKSIMTNLTSLVLYCISSSRLNPCVLEFPMLYQRRLGLRD